MWHRRLRLLGAGSVHLVSRRRFPPLLLSRSLFHSPSLRYGKARAIELTYHDGTCTLAVPLPLDGFDEERVFRLPFGNLFVMVVQFFRINDGH